MLQPRPLHIITEEDETRSRSPSPMAGYLSSSSVSSGLKARRRHHNLSASDIQIARDFVGIGDEESQQETEDRLMLVPPSSARLPKTPSPMSSPDSFRLTFTEGSYDFPHPPIPTPSSRKISSFCSSPTSSSSSGSSPSSGSAGLPLTPSSSDSDEDFFQLPSPRFNPRRAAIQPLVIHKHFSPSLPILEVTGADDELEPSGKPTPLYDTFSLSAYTSPSSNGSFYESDNESDSEWYGKELSKVVTVSAPVEGTLQNSRPDSLFLPAGHVTSRASKRESSVFPAPAPKRASTRRPYIPNYPPPPPPVAPRPRRSSNIPTSPISPLDSHMSFGQFMSPSPSPTRPPPRTSLPADFSFENDEDAESEFSFAIYQVQLDEEEERYPRVASPSTASAYSQPSYCYPHSEYSTSEDYGSPLDQAEFDLDAEYPMMLPLSLPGSPIDFEADVARELRMRGMMVSPPPLPVVLEEPQEGLARSETASVYSAYERPRTPPRISTPASNSDWSFSTHSPVPSRSSSYGHLPQEPVLKSKWSSSTLASVREEHERRTSRFKLNFGVTSPTKKRSSPSPSGSRHAKKSSIGGTPLSPMSFIGASGKKKSPQRVMSAGRRELDAYPPISMVSGVKRRTSVSTISDAGSEETSSSSASNGLRRKPIPVELFLRR
ncbi:hypothetical protein CC1G_05459 [Coprinopsis cinerea okayama7|uniref:Uncharacterized protein n=1 Tax=Coprinopsis cinerea (strain Okayama-7 / 130 / ATCC MYA-4618 / FGSC 9003) TaxID=240176 RepID=A8P5C1_COPC7|nr:hypothetical protein CC1G_05459 [Coprinopsis cinerea okayama7\|eukprot:XP_001838906.2 hypothetical protein CC1G_05459 [Coprinopsis cinerea okayama7\